MVSWLSKYERIAIGKRSNLAFCPLLAGHIRGVHDSV